MPKPKHTTDLAPNLRLSGMGTATVQIYNMVITFVDNVPVAFERGDARYRLVDPVAGGNNYLYGHTRGAKNLQPASPEKFETLLYANLRVAARKLDARHDIVAESRQFTDILMKSAEQLETIMNNEWQDPALLREAVADARSFMLERLIGLFKKSNEEVHQVTVRNISTKALRDAINAGRLRPPKTKE